MHFLFLICMICRVFQNFLVLEYFKNKDRTKLTLVKIHKLSYKKVQKMAVSSTRQSRVKAQTWERKETNFLQSSKKQFVVGHEHKAV